MIDTHVNFHAEAFADDRSDILVRARAAGVTGFIAVCDRLGAAEDIADLVADIPCMWHSVGVHPHHASEVPDLDAETLVRASAGGKVCALGETGLDYYKNYSPRPAQLRAFEVHIEAARHTGLPVIIHCREAEEDMAQVLERQMAQGTFVPLMHCYTGSIGLAKLAAGMGAYFSVSGIATFSNADKVRETIAGLPRDRIVIETDSPYLTPVPHRGTRNEPANLRYVCSALADLLDIGIGEAAALTSANAQRLFAKAF